MTRLWKITVQVHGSTWIETWFSEASGPHVAIARLLRRRYKNVEQATVSFAEASKEELEKCLKEKGREKL